jgi:cyclase
MALPPPRTVEVADGAFAYVQPDGSWFINTAGFLAGPDGAIVVDTCATEQRTRALRAAVADTARVPVHTVVNTHHHGDHTHGNGVFGEAVIVAHERTVEEMRRAPAPEALAAVWEAPEWGDIALRLPNLVFRDGVTLLSGERRCEVRYIGGPAHTTNDSVVWLPEERVLYTGDLVFNGGTPFALMGSIAGWIEALDTLEGFGAQTIVPGHGEVCGPEVFTTVRTYLEFVRDTARAAKDAGVSALEAALETDLGAFAELSDPERLVGNLHRAYAELDGAARGADIDLFAALGEMVTYNGGRKLRCLA